MRAAGGIVIGKTNTPEFGLGSHTFNAVFGATRNAYDPSRRPAAAAAAPPSRSRTRMLAVADGSDFMGSLRNPAGWNNVFGMRPSQGRVPTWPAVDVWVTQLGTEGRWRATSATSRPCSTCRPATTRACRLSLAGTPSFADRRWPHARPRPGAHRLAGGPRRPPGDGGRRARRAASTALAPLQASARGRGGRARLRAEARVGGWLVWRRWLVAGRIAPFPREPGAARGSSPKRCGSTTRRRGDRHADLAASAQRTAFYQQMLALFERYDVLALPAAQVWPFDAAERWPTQIAGRAMDTYHRWMEVTIYADVRGPAGD